MDLFVPYKVGDLAESKCFIKGYRGAWFRCKIHDMRVTESGHSEYYLEYIDYPDERKEWIMLYQKNPACSEQQSSDQIMIRPSFPQWHWNDQVPEQYPDNGVVAIVKESWKVGDMVDWLSEGCYWSGIITKLLKEDMLEVELLKPPRGEGRRYAANRNDLRPTLDWSLEGGWTVPLSQAKRKSWHVVRLVHCISTDSEKSESEEEISSGDEYNEDNGGDSQDVLLQVLSSDTSQEAPGSPVPKPSSPAKSTSSLNAEDDATLTAMADMEPNPSSKSRAPSDGVQPAAVTSSRPGTGIVEQEERGVGSSSIKQEQAVDVQDQYQHTVAEVRGRLKDLLERTLLMERRAALFGHFGWASGHAPSKRKKKNEK